MPAHFAYVLILLISGIFLISWTVTADKDEEGIGRRIPPLVPEELTDYINELRRSQGAKNMVEVRWDDNLASEAKRKTEPCTRLEPGTLDAFKSTQGVVYGHMQFTNMSQFVERWYEEKRNFGYSVSWCKEECANYRTLVRSDLTKVGCAVKWCSPLRGFERVVTKGIFMACLYFTPNFKHQLSTAFAKGKPCSDCPKNFNICKKQLCSGPDSSYPPWRPDLMVFRGIEVVRGSRANGLMAGAIVGVIVTLDVLLFRL